MSLCHPVKFNHHLVIGHPLPNPGQSCAIVDGAAQYSWQSSMCDKKLGYICYSEGAVALPAPGKETYQFYSILFRTVTVLLFCIWFIVRFPSLITYVSLLFL